MNNEAEALRQAMIAGLVQRGELSATWRRAFEQVPRHWFIPERVWVHDPEVEGPDLLPVNRADDPAGWLELAYANAPVNTQVDDGRPDCSGRGREVSSSASQPAVVAEMLSALQVEPGMRVLEIGTGTGWNTGLLAHRLGAENVVSVEVDPAVAERARVRLADAGFGVVRVVTGDGADGWVDGAPYDRVLATVAAPVVPYPWVAQTCPGGLVVVPWGTSFYPAGLLRLEGGTGRGRVVGSASFMALRAQRTPRTSVSDVHDGGPVAVSTTDLHPWYVAEDVDPAIAIGLRVPTVQHHYRDGVLYLVDRVSRSWATVEISTDGPYTVEQAGPRKLWDEVHTAYRWWQEAGEPTAADWLVTVTPTAQHIELANRG